MYINNQDICKTRTPSGEQVLFLPEACLYNAGDRAFERAVVSSTGLVIRRLSKTEGEVFDSRLPAGTHYVPVMASEARVVRTWVELEQATIFDKFNTYCPNDLGYLRTTPIWLVPKDQEPCAADFIDPAPSTYIVQAYDFCKDVEDVYRSMPIEKIRKLLPHMRVYVEQVWVHLNN